jgi:hypothetical protein
MKTTDDRAFSVYVLESDHESRESQHEFMESVVEVLRISTVDVVHV